MNISFTLRCLVCCVTLAASASLARANVVGYVDKKTPQSIATVITTSNSPANTPLNQVPEPSTGSLILIGLGSVGLAMKLRKRA